MKKVNLFEELLRERNKQISSIELKSLIKDIWEKEDLKKNRIANSLNDKNNKNFNKMKFENMETKEYCVRYDAINKRIAELENE